ncbi:leucine-rich repeat protein, partial [Duncaniella muris]
MNDLAIHLYLIIRYINLSFNYFCNFYRIIVKYKIVDSHLEIIGYDPVELKGDVKPYATVKYLGTTYNTRIIAEEAFRGSSITSINIPNSVTEIGGSAFSGCSFLTSITIPNSV